MDNIRYMISDAANLVNVESHVLRYWEEELELDIPRNEMGHRYYTEDNIREFIKIKNWKEQGYQLKAIRMLVQEERMNKMAGAKNAVHNQLMRNEFLHKEELEENFATNTVKLEQFQLIMNNIVKNALEENNRALGKEVGIQVGEKVIKEMNYLMRVQDEADEERYKKLDAVIRAHGKSKKIKEEKPQKEKRFFRREKKLKANLGV